MDRRIACNCKLRRAAKSAIVICRAVIWVDRIRFTATGPACVYNRSVSALVCLMVSPQFAVSGCSRRRVLTDPETRRHRRACAVVLLCGCFR